MTITETVLIKNNAHRKPLLKQGINLNKGVFLQAYPHIMCKTCLSFPFFLIMFLMQGFSLVFYSVNEFLSLLVCLQAFT